MFANFKNLLRAHQQLSLLAVMSCILVVSIGRAWGQAPTPAPKPLPLYEMRSEFYDKVRAKAVEMSSPAPAGGAAPDALKYSSVKEEKNIIFEGDITITDGSQRLAIFSDDGCDVELWRNGVTNPTIYKLVARNGQGQSLPKLDQSLYKVPFDFDARDSGGNLISSYKVRITYSNTSYQGSSDIDGATLFIYKAYPTTTGPGPKGKRTTKGMKFSNQ